MRFLNPVRCISTARCSLWPHALKVVACHRGSIATAAVAARQATNMGAEDIIQSPNDKKSYRHLKLSNGIAVLLIHDPAVAEALATAEDVKQDMDVSEDSEQQSGSGSGSAGDEDMSGSGSGSDDGSSGSEDDDDDGEESDAEGGGAKQGKKQKGQTAGSKKAAAAMAVGVGSFSDPPEMQGLSHYLEHMLFMGSDKFPDENEYDSYLSKHGGSSNAFTELEFTNYHFEVAPAHLEAALDRFAQFFVAPLFQVRRELTAGLFDATGTDVCAYCS
eukprot:GHRQ01022665.1.p1 GENE.GHRQ01022665.1~~GHRQ01022665.1.p1  ORF type:complete len:274 (+),score=115.83 GHRQ01022665.1:417-1238(+)